MSSVVFRSILGGQERTQTHTGASTETGTRRELPGTVLDGSEASTYAEKEKIHLACRGVLGLPSEPSSDSDDTADDVVEIKRNSLV